MNNKLKDKTLIGKWNIEVNTSIENVWGILNDSSNMAIWGKSFVKHTTAGQEYFGAIRHCELQMGNKTGKVEEETIIYQPNDEIFWKMNEDSFGMKKVMNEFIFGFKTKIIDSSRTYVEFQQFFRPTNLLKKWIVKLIMKPKMAKTNRVLLIDFKELIEKT